MDLIFFFLILFQCFIGHLLVCFDFCFCVFSCVSLFCFVLFLFLFEHRVGWVERWEGSGKNLGRVKHDQNVLHGNFFLIIKRKKDDPFAIL